MRIEFKRLTQVEKNDIIELMNQPLVRRHLPLLGETFSEDDCDDFLAAKERMWDKHGYGPWAFVMEGEFIGWGGLQPERGEADLGLVLHPRYWGMGRVLYKEIIKRAFDELGFDSVTILLPPTRTRIKGVLRLGFEHDGKIVVGGEQFIRYRLTPP